MFSSRTVDEIKVPTLEEASERYRALKVREAELDQRRIALEADLQALGAEGRRLQMTRDTEHDRDRIAAAEEKARRTAALIGDIVPVKVQSSTALGPSIVEETVSRRDQLDDVKEALRLLRIEIQAEAKVASKVVCDAVKADHDRRAKAVADAFVGLVAATREYRHLAGRLNKAGIMWARLGPLPYDTALGPVPDRFAGHIAPLVSAMTRRGDLDLSRLKGR